MTDLPVYAFLVRKPVPPRLATFSRKQLVTGGITDKEILAEMDKYRPEQVLMGRFVIPALETYLKKNYTLVMDPGYLRLFVRNDLNPVAESIH
jgi:hypothetical protein